MVSYPRPQSSTSVLTSLAEDGHLETPQLVLQPMPTDDPNDPLVYTPPPTVFYKSLNLARIGHVLAN